MGSNQDAANHRSSNQDSQVSLYTSRRSWLVKKGCCGQLDKSSFGSNDYCDVIERILKPACNGKSRHVISSDQLRRLYISCHHHSHNQTTSDESYLVHWSL